MARHPHSSRNKRKTKSTMKKRSGGMVRKLSNGGYGRPGRTSMNNNMRYTGNGGGRADCPRGMKKCWEGLLQGQCIDQNDYCPSGESRTMQEGGYTRPGGMQTTARPRSLRRRRPKRQPRIGLHSVAPGGNGNNPMDKTGIGGGHFLDDAFPYGVWNEDDTGYGNQVMTPCEGMGMVACPRGGCAASLAECGDMKFNPRKNVMSSYGRGGRTCGGMNQPPCNGGYRRGGSVRRPKGRRYRRGGTCRGGGCR
jgi:hypothetical protein